MGRPRKHNILASITNDATNAVNSVVDAVDANTSTANASDTDTADTGFDVVDPASISGDSGGKPGRKPRAAYGSRKTSAGKNDLGGIESVLLSAHMMAGHWFNAAELALAPEEAKAMAEAINNVSQHYGQIINPVVMAWLQLAMVCGGIYGSRAIVISKRIREENARKPAPVKVVDFRSVSRTVESPGAVPTKATAQTSPSGMFGTDFASGGEILVAE